MTALTTAHIMELDTDPREHAALVLNEKTGEIELISTAFGDASGYDENGPVEDPDALVVLLDREGIQAQIDSEVMDEDGHVTLEGAAILMDIVADEHHLQREVSYALETRDETGFRTVTTGTGQTAGLNEEHALAILDTTWDEMRANAESDDQADEMMALWRARVVTGPVERLGEHDLPPTQSAVCDGSHYRASVTVRAIRDIQREQRRLAQARREQVRRLVEVTGSQVAAAAHLGVSQPTISEMIKQIR